jgi:hypothetical protein
MSDPVLLARLRALLDDLDSVSEKLRRPAWGSQQPSLRAEMLVDSLWYGLEVTLIKEIDRQKRALEEIAREVTQSSVNDPAALTAAWTRYAKAFRESQGILRECLEIIGTLAIRNNDLDKRILHVADELIRECLVLSTGEERYYLLVHGMEETVTKAKSRIIRLRFPEWTIWDLPLAAHELGHVIVSDTLAREKQDDDDRRILEPFVKKLRDSLVGLHPEWNEQIQDGGIKAQEAERWAEDRVHDFLADAFATYTMGPAYACAAILLRLNPSLAASCGRPSDAQRAHVILSMLEWASESLPVINPYRQVVDDLRRYWDDTLSRVNPHGKLSPAYEGWLKELSEAFGKETGPNSFMTSALYPAKGVRAGWHRAQVWATQWLEEQEQSSEKLTVPELSGENMRDVLNATWLCRLNIVKTIGQAGIEKQIRPLKNLQEIGQEVCNAIMGLKRVGSPHQITAPNTGGRV